MPAMWNARRTPGAPCLRLRRDHRRRKGCCFGGQTAWPLRCRDPQCRCRLSGGPSRHIRWSAACLRDQHIVGLPSDRAGRAAETPRLSQFRHASRRQRQSRRHPLESCRWNGSTAYAESKLHDATLAFAIARAWPGRLNLLEPGWVATRMVALAAPDDINQAHLTPGSGSPPETTQRRTSRVRFPSSEVQ